jgi:hypothetical protein
MPARTQSKSTPKSKPTPKPSKTTSGFNLESLLAKQAPSAKTTPPAMPVKQVLAEALRLAQEAGKYRALILAAPGFEARHVDDLPQLTEALQTAEDAWHAGQGDVHARSTVTARHQGEHLKSQLVATARYLFRKEPTELEVIDGMAHGTTVAELLADLNGLGAFVTKHQARFTAAKQPADLADQARALAKTLAAGNGKSESVDLQARRNQIFHLLQESMDEVREAARFQLRDAPAKLAPMLSTYNAVRQRRLRTEKANQASPPSPPGPSQK